MARSVDGAQAPKKPTRSTGARAHARPSGRRPTRAAALPRDTYRPRTLTGAVVKGIQKAPSGLKTAGALALPVTLILDGMSLLARLGRKSPRPGSPRKTRIPAGR